jgi:hypothetical protein
MGTQLLRFHLVSAMFLMQTAARVASSTKPKVDALSLAKIIREITKQAEEVVQVLEDACKNAANNEEKAKARSTLPSVLRVELRRIEDEVFAGSGFSREDILAAQLYYSSSSGGAAPPGSRDYREASKSLKQKVGKYLITQKSAIEAMLAAHDAQVEATDDMVDWALERTGNNPQHPHFQAAIQQRSQIMLNEACIAECGMGVMELINYIEKESKADPRFNRAAQSAMEGASQLVNQALNNALMARMGGGMMGM